MLTWLSEKISEFVSTSIGQATIQFFFNLDLMLLNFLINVYDLIIVLARVQIFQEETIQALAMNIYGILGVVMLFILAFNLLSYMVNPDLILDKQKGLGNIVSKVIITLILIVAVPFIFSYAFYFQSYLVGDENRPSIIINIFHGSPRAIDTSPASYMAAGMMKAFLRCDVDAGCNELAYEAFASRFEHIGEFIDPTDQGYTYYFIIASAAIGVLLIMLIMFCLDIALRTVKLGFLQVFAPIAIVSYVHPKSSESGLFKKWVDMSVSTYLNLFIRIAAFAFMAFALTLLPELNFGTTEGEGGAILEILIILGLLMFLKEAPKMISDIMGIKEEGLFTLNPFKKLADIPGVSLSTGLGFGAAATGIGALGSGITGYKHGGIAGALRGGMHGAHIGAGKVRSAKGNIWQQMAGAVTTPFGLGGKVGKHVVGDHYKTPLERYGQRLEEAGQRGAFERKYREDLQKGQEDFNVINNAANEARARGEDAKLASIKAKASLFKNPIVSEAISDYETKNERWKKISSQFEAHRIRYENLQNPTEQQTNEYLAARRKNFQVENDKNDAKGNLDKVLEVNKTDKERHDRITNYEQRVESRERLQDNVTEKNKQQPTNVPSPKNTNEEKVEVDGKIYRRNSAGILVPDDK